MKKRLLLLLLISFTLLTACGGDDGASESGALSDSDEISKSTISEDSIGYTEAQLSDELFQFSMKINGVSYKLPAMQSFFTSNGWSIAEPSLQSLKSSFIAKATLSDGKTTFDIQVVNPTNEEKSFDDCPIGRLSYDFSGEAEISIAGDFSLNDATKKSLVEKFGEPESEETHSDFSEIIYGSRKTSGNYASYLFRFNKSGKITYFSIVNQYMPD